MRIKNLFTVPDGAKVTEKMFARVLISSICSILLCMTCLVSTTWAWFTISIKNTGNEIKIGEPTVSVTVDGDANFAKGTTLAAGMHQVVITHAGDADSFDKKSTLYVTLMLGEYSAVCPLNSEIGYTQQIDITVASGKECGLSWEATWFVPGGNTNSIIDGAITIEEEAPETNGETTLPSGTDNTTLAETGTPADGTTAAVTTPPADGTTEAVTTPPADGTTEAVTTPPANGTTEAVTTPPANGTTEAVTTPPADSTTEAVTTPPADGTTEAVTTPPADGTTEAVTTPPADGTTEAVTTPPADGTTEAVTTPPADSTTEAVTTPPTEETTAPAE